MLSRLRSKGSTALADPYKLTKTNILIRQGGFERPTFCSGGSRDRVGPSGFRQFTSAGMAVSGPIRRQWVSSGSQVSYGLMLARQTPLSPLYEAQTVGR